MIVSVGFKLHGSSIAQWNHLLDTHDNRSKTVLAGTPRAIRSDEWAVFTPFIITQQRTGFPLQNHQIGIGNSTLCINVPCKHFTTLFRPQFIAFFILPLEYAYSFFWNMKIFGCLIGLFLLFRILTGNKFGLSLAGSVLLLSSSFTQWWFSVYIPELFLGFSAILIGAFYWTFGQNRKEIIVGMVLAFYFSIYFATIFYPPFQIQVAFTGILIYTGIVFTNRQAAFKKKYRCIQGTALFIAIATFTVLMFYYLKDLREVLITVMQTEYPGKRITHGGSGYLHHMISGYWSYYFRETRFPSCFGNTCEATNFFYITPIIIPYFLIIKRKISWNATVFLLSVYGLILLSWYFIGLPAFLSLPFQLHRIPEVRTYIGLGLIDICLSVILLAGLPHTKRNTSSVLSHTCILIPILGTICAGLYFKQTVFPLMPLYIILLTTIACGFSSYLLCTGKKNYALYPLVCLMLLNMRINPIACGLKSFTESELSEVIEKIHNEGSETWITDNWIFGNYLKANGETVYNGTRYTPNFEQMMLLDPTGVNKAIYNRYSHMDINPINNILLGLQAHFEAIAPDYYRIILNPGSNLFKKISVSHLFLTQPVHHPCLEEIYRNIELNHYIYKYKPTDIPEKLLNQELSSNILVNFDYIGDTLFNPHQPVYKLSDNASFIQGWVIDKADTETYHKVFMLYKGQILHAPCNIERSDVKERYQIKDGKCGFRIKVPQSIDTDLEPVFFAFETKQGKIYRAQLAPIYLGHPDPAQDQKTVSDTSNLTNAGAIITQD